MADTARRTGPGRRPGARTLALAALLGLLLFEALHSAVRYAARAPVRGEVARAAAAGTVAVLAIGDSFTYGIGAPPGLSWPQQLAGIRRARGEVEPVIDLAVPGANSSEAVEVLEGALQAGARPRWVVAAIGNNNSWNLRRASFWTDFPAEAVPAGVAERVAASTGLGRAWAAFGTRGSAWPVEVIDPDAPDAYSSARPVVEESGIRREQPFLKRWLLHDHRRLCALAAEAGARVAVMTYHWGWRYVREAQVEASRECPGAVLVDNRNFGVLSHPAAEFVSDDGWHPNERGYADVARRLDRAMAGR